MNLKEYEISYEHLSNSEKQEFQDGYKSKNLKMVSSPNVHVLLKQILKDEEKKMEKKETKAEVVAETKPIIKESKEIAVIEKKEMSLADIKEVGKILYMSKMFSNVQNEQQALAKILKGKELGLGAMSSLEKIYVVNGKTAIESGLMADLIKRTGKYNYRIIELTNLKCSINFFEGKEKVGNSTFTIEDASRAGLSGKDIYKKYPRNMLFGRALSNGARWHCPDAIGGAYTTEELDFDDKSIIQAEVIEVENVPCETKKEENKLEPKIEKAEVVEKTRKELIQELKDKYGLEKMKDIKSKLKLEPKLNELDEKDWSKFLKELTGVDF